MDATSLPFSEQFFVVMHACTGFISIADALFMSTLGAVPVGIIVLIMLRSKPSTIKGTQPNKEIIREREVVTREVVMIPCAYCRGLMPQTSAFCPNCGARRRIA